MLIIVCYNSGYVARRENHSTFYVAGHDWVMLYSSPYKMMFDLTIKGNKLLGLFFLKPFVVFSKEMEQSRKSSLLVVMICNRKIFLRLTSTSVSHHSSSIFSLTRWFSADTCNSVTAIEGVIWALAISTSQTLSSFPIKAHIFKGVKVCLTCFFLFLREIKLERIHYYRTTIC